MFLSSVRGASRSVLTLSVKEDVGNSQWQIIVQGEALLSVTENDVVPRTDLFRK